MPPTKSRPGSNEKIAVMAQRATNHEPLHQPCDANLFDNKNEEEKPDGERNGNETAPIKVDT